MTDSAREMTLHEYVEALPGSHRARRDLEKLEADLAAARERAREWKKRAKAYDKQAASWMRMLHEEMQESTDLSWAVLHGLPDFDTLQNVADYGRWQAIYERVRAEEASDD